MRPRACLPRLWAGARRRGRTVKTALEGFVTCLHRERWSGAPRLAFLAEESRLRQTEITDRLGVQVRNATELLLQAFDEADVTCGGALLENHHTPDDIYRMAVYTVMRLIFLLFAEDRRLLPHGQPAFDEHYGVSRLLFSQTFQVLKTWKVFPVTMALMPPSRLKRVTD